MSQSLVEAVDARVAILAGRVDDLERCVETLNLKVADLLVLALNGRPIPADFGRMKYFHRNGGLKAGNRLSDAPESTDQTNHAPTTQEMSR